MESHRDRAGRQSLAALAAVVLLASGCDPASERRASAPTFARDVAPILFERCATCHRANGAAPFSLLAYDDASRRARQIAEVTSTRYMPPWLPEPGHGAFEGERLLSDEERDILKRWAETGAPEGEAAAAPPAPQWREEWELGEPDLVVEMPEAYSLPAEGQDVFRNFVVPVLLDRPRYVEAFELLPSERRLVHHATITIDSRRASRRLDAAEPGPGFEGMRSAPGVVMPDGYFLGWTPGKSAYRERAGMSWTLEPGSDLVLQLHMPTTGKPEQVKVRVGFYFTDVPPTVVPVTIRLGSRHFEIPADVSDFRVEDRYVMPVDSRAFSIYPHAHYLARDMRARAVRPDGTEEDLIHIEDWDFNWQDFYRYREPVFLPKGTVVEMVYTFDNSADNPRNPSHPPTPVSYGPLSTDEMADLYLQLVPDSERELDLLRSDYTAKELNDMVLELDFELERSPDDADLLNSLGVVYERLGRTDEAIAAIRRALTLDPRNRHAHFNLGTLLVPRGERAEAIRHFRAVLEVEPDCADCRVRLGNALRDEGAFEEAIAELTHAVALDPAYVWGHYSLGIALQIAGRADDAIMEYRRVVELEPTNAEARVSLGAALAGERRCTPAISELNRAATLEPEWPEPLARLAWALSQCPSAMPDAGARAVEYASHAAQMTGYDDPAVLDTLGDALANAGRSAEAREAWSRALELAVERADPLAAALQAKLSREP